MSFIFFLAHSNIPYEKNTLDEISGALHWLSLLRFNYTDKITGKLGICVHVCMCKHQIKNLNNFLGHVCTITPILVLHKGLPKIT